MAHSPTLGPDLRRRPWRHVLACALTAIAIVPIIVVPEASAASRSEVARTPPAPPTGGLLFGAYAQPRDDEDDQAALADLEAAVGRKLDLHRVYARWDDELPSANLTADIARGRTPVLSILPQRSDGSKVSWGSIAHGSQDAVIAEQADAIADLNAPLFVVFHHEPDQAQGFGTPAEFVAAWQHYASVFESRGAGNVAWTWTMTPASFGSQTVGAGADAFYPGDDVVDWLALDAYNWFGCKAGKPTAWRSLATIIDPFRAWSSGHGKPLMLAEWGSVEDPSQPMRKGNWLRGAIDELRDRPEFKAAVYFHALGSCSWWLDTSDASLDAFAEVGGTATAHGRTSAELIPSVGLGPAPLAVTFDGSRSTGAQSNTGTGIATYELNFGDGSPPASGSGSPPSNLSHTYGGGIFTAVLRVTDSVGGSATDTRTITVASPPTVTGSETDITSTSAALHAWVNGNGLMATAYFEWGTTTSYGNRSQLYSTPAQTWPTRFDLPLSGLQPGTRYFWRVVAVSEAGTTPLARMFDTPGPPTPVTSAATRVGRTSAQLNGTVNPHTLTTTWWFEWGRTTTYGSKTSIETLTPATWAKTVSATVSGLAPNTTYHVRLVAQNALGTRYGVDRVLTTTA